jgi:hypothetical protein
MAHATAEQHTSRLPPISMRQRSRQMSRLVNEQLNPAMRLPNIVDVVQQIESEYREMPGLSITEAQAQRLWVLDRTTCRQALEALVHRGVLRRTRRESYVRVESATPGSDPHVTRRE